jgi:hypothetical protein
MSVKLQNIAAASFLPGFQNIGSVSGSALITGAIPASGNLIGTFVINFPDPNVISQIRVNLPQASGELAINWFPVMGTIQLVDAIGQYTLIMYVLSDPAGRRINFNFVNTNNSSPPPFVNFPINIYAHLFTFHW